MGGGGGHHGGHHEEQAYFLGIRPDSPYEGFEVIYGLTILGSFLVVAGGASMKTDDDFLTWARREALAREQVIANGCEVEFGKYYHKTEYKEETLGAPPTLADE